MLIALNSFTIILLTLLMNSACVNLILLTLFCDWIFEYIFEKVIFVGIKYEKINMRESVEWFFSCGKNIENLLANIL